MDLKWIEDLVALEAAGSIVRAAQARHVTHPAFGRRIQALEAWAGTALVVRRAGRVELTTAGRDLLRLAQPMLEGLLAARSGWRPGPTPDGIETLRVGTGRTLARTRVAAWLSQMGRLMRGHRVELRTAAMAEAAAMFERGEVDLLCGYEHPALSLRLSAQRFRYLTLGHDRLVPVERSTGRRAATGGPTGGRWITYDPALALGRLLSDHLSRAAAPGLGPPWLTCDSADAVLALVEGGLGAAWLPWSLVAEGCRSGRLRRLGGLADEAHFEVRLYRPRARRGPLLEAVWAATQARRNDD